MPGRSGGHTPAVTSSARSGKRARRPPDQGPLDVPGARMHHKPGRLVHHRHRVVGEDDLEAHIGIRRHPGVPRPRAAEWSGWPPRASTCPADRDR